LRWTASGWLETKMGGHLPRYQGKLWKHWMLTDIIQYLFLDLMLSYTDIFFLGFVHNFPCGWLLATGRFLWNLDPSLLSELSLLSWVFQVLSNLSYKQLILIFWFLSWPQFIMSITWPAGPMLIKVCCLLYEDSIMKPTKHCLKRGGAGIRGAKGM
jgi:hypothetical protein